MFLENVVRKIILNGFENEGAFIGNASAFFYSNTY